MNTEVQKNNSQNKFSEGDFVSFSLKGVYQVDHIEKLTLAGDPQDYYVLSHAFNKTIHKTFAPVASAAAAGVREVIHKDELEKFEDFVMNLEIDPEDLNQNSNKKMIAYEKRIKKNGFWAIVDTYFCVDFDLKKTKRMDKRYIQFLDRLKNHLVEEITLSTGRELSDVEDYVEETLAKFPNN